MAKWCEALGCGRYLPIFLPSILLTVFERFIPQHSPLSLTSWFLQGLVFSVFVIAIASLVVMVTPSGGQVPEPTSMAIFGLGALGMAYRARRKTKA